MTPKQERFAQEYMIDLNATQAAIRTGYSEHTAAEQGSRLLRNAKVAAAIQAAQAEFRERLEVSVESVTLQLRQAYDEAKNNGQSGAMVQATMGIAKLHGLLVDKTEDVTKSAADMTDSELVAESVRVRTELISLMSRSELDVEADRVQAELALIDAARESKPPVVTKH